MPTIKKRILRMKKTNRLTDDQRCHLVLDLSLSGAFPFEDDDDRRRVWFQYRDEMLADINIPFLKRESFLHLLRDDLRPAAYYDYECPEFYERKILNDAKRAEFRLYDREPVLESEYDFLKRNGLLTKRDEEVTLEIEKQKSESMKFQGNANLLFT